MAAHQDRLPLVQLRVGAAFDFHAGKVRQAVPAAQPTVRVAARAPTVAGTRAYLTLGVVVPSRVEPARAASHAVWTPRQEPRATASWSCHTILVRVPGQSLAKRGTLIRHMEATFDHAPPAAPTDALARTLPSRARTVAVLVASDVVAWAVSIALGAVASRLVGHPLAAADGPLIALGLLLMPAVYGGAHLYPAAGVSRVDEFRRLTFASSVVWLAVAATYAFLMRATDSAPLVFIWLFSLVAVPTARGLARHLTKRCAWYGVPVVVLGAGRAAELLVRRLQRFPANGYRAVACFDDDPRRHGHRIHGVPVVGALVDAAPYAARGVRHAILAIPTLPGHETARIARTVARRFPNVILMPEFTGLASVGVGLRNLGGLVGVHVRHELLRRRNHVAKRALDLALLVPVGLIAAPLIGLAAVAIRIVSPGASPFYAQEREGLAGRPFRMWKLRSMHADADARLEAHLAANPAAAAEWASKFKLANDPRVLPGVGHLLRNASLDELPQVWNIARGEMSFVGPRPFPRYHLEAFDAEFSELRATVRPGLTGLWQVVARADADLALQQELDTLYIDNWSVWMDVYLIARTPWSVLHGDGAY